MSIPQEPARGAAAFASRDFRRYQLARLLVIIGAEAQEVAVSWQIYAITHRAIDLGYAGLALFLPGILFLLGTGRSFSGPASSAFLPHLVPKEDFVNAVSWGASIFQLANFIGPALGGLLFTLPLVHWLPSPIGKHLEGGAIVYVFALATLFGFLFLLASLWVRPGRQEQ